MQLTIGNVTHTLNNSIGTDTTETKIQNITPSLDNLTTTESDTSETKIQNITPSLDNLTLTESDILQKLFTKAITDGLDGLLKIILPHVDPNIHNNQAIRLAIQAGHIKIVRILLEDSRVDPADSDNYAIRLAAGYGHTEIVELLLRDPRVNPADSDNYAIRLAAGYGHTETVGLLLADPRTNPNNNIAYIIDRAALHNYVDIIKLLINDPRTDLSIILTCTIFQLEKNGHGEIAELIRSRQETLLRYKMSEVIESAQSLADKQAYLSKLDCTSIKIETDIQTGAVLVCVVFDC